MQWITQVLSIYIYTLIVIYNNWRAGDEQGALAILGITLITQKLTSELWTTTNNWESRNIKFKNSRLSFFFIFVSFFILFFIYFHFSIFRTLGLGWSVTSDGMVTTFDHRTWEKEVKGSETKWYHTTWTPHVDLMLNTWSFRVGCTVPSTDHL